MKFMTPVELTGGDDVVNFMTPSEHGTRKEAA
jgi:hypothetical protein